MSIERMLDQLDELLEKSWELPFSGGKTVVDAERVMEVIDTIRLELPREIQQAKAVVSERNNIINDAKKEAESIVRVAEDRAKALVEENEIVKEAKAKANELCEKSKAKAREMQKAASDYADDLMRRTDEVLAQSLDEVRKTRQSLKKSNGVQ